MYWVLNPVHRLLISYMWVINILYIGSLYPVFMQLICWISIVYVFIHHLPSGDRPVIGDRCGDRLRTTCHHALNSDEQGCSWLPVIGDRGKCEKLLCISALPASFFSPSLAHIRTHEYNNVSLPLIPLSFSSVVEKHVLQHRYDSAS